MPRGRGEGASVSPVGVMTSPPISVSVLASIHRLAWGEAAGGSAGTASWWWSRFGRCRAASMKRCSLLSACERVVVVCGRARSAVAGQVSSGSERMRLSAVLNSLCHGHRAGSRSTHCRLRLTSRPGSSRSRVRMVRATVSCSVGCMSPSRAVQRIRLCASTAQASQAALAKNRPEGQCWRPAPSFRSRMASSTVA